MARTVTYVLCHVLTADAVATRGAAHQPSVRVGQRDAQTIDLELGDVGHGIRGAKAAPHAVVEGAELRLVVGIVERQHRYSVLDGGKAFRRPPANALCRRVGRDQLGMLRFELAQLAQQRVEFGVRKFGRGVDVVELFVPANLGAKMVDAGGCRFHRSREST